LLKRDFSASEARVSLVVSAATFAVALASPFIGLFADAIGRKRVIVPCLFALAFTTLGCTLSHNLHQLILWRFLGGICTPGIIAVTLAYISEEAHERATGSVTALYVTGTVVGGLVGRISSAIVADYRPWQWSFGILTILTFLGAAAVAILLPPSRRFERHTQWRQSFDAMRHHLTNPRLLATYLIGFIILFAHVGLFTYINFHLAEPPFSLSTSQLGAIFLVYALGIVITPLSGRLIDRFGHRAGLCVAVALTVPGCLLTLLPNLPLIIFGIAIASSGVFVAQSSASSHIGRAADGARSVASGLYVSCYYLGGSVGATALAAPYHLGHWPAVVVSVILLQLAALAITWRFFAAKPPSPPRSHELPLPLE